MVRAVLDAMTRRDEVALRTLALDEREFREVVWPELPASRPERNLPFSFVWGDLRVKSDSGLARTLGEYGGRTFEVEHVSFAGGTSQYRTFVVHREVVVVARDSAGRRETLQPFGSAIEKNGGFEVFSYVVD